MTEGTRILVVDDEAPLRDLVTRYLRREGYDVRAASDGPTALVIEGEGLDPGTFLPEA